MYDVGQVLYVIFRNKQKVIPVRVMEQVVRRSLDGETIQYLVEIPGRSDFVDLDSLERETYTTLQEVRDSLRQNIWKVVEEMVEKAEKIANNFFGDDPAAGAESISDIPVTSSDNAQVVLENGQLANIIDNSVLQQIDS